MNRKQRRATQAAKKKVETVKSEFEGICPGCGGNFAFGDTASTEDNDRVPWVLHEIPTCPDFDNREIIEYLKWINDVQEAEKRKSVQE